MPSNNVEWSFIEDKMSIVEPFQKATMIIIFKASIRLIELELVFVLISTKNLGEKKVIFFIFFGIFFIFFIEIEILGFS